LRDCANGSCTDDDTHFVKRTDLTVRDAAKRIYSVPPDKVDQPYDPSIIFDLADEPEKYIHVALGPVSRGVQFVMPIPQPIYTPKYADTIALWCCAGKRTLSTYLNTLHDYADRLDVPAQPLSAA